LVGLGVEKDRVVRLIRVRSDADCFVPKVEATGQIKFVPGARRDKDINARAA